MHIDNETQKVFPGQVVYILSLNSKQFIENVESSDPSWKKEDEIILNHAGR